MSSNWTPPFRAENEWVIDARGVTVARSYGMGMTMQRAADIAAALNEAATLTPTRPTADDIRRQMTPNGGWTRETLAAWGVPWPPPEGWKAKLIQQAEAAVTEKDSG